MKTEALSRLWILVRREIWESPVAFKWTPLIIAGFILLVTALTLIIGARVDNEMVFTIDGIRLYAEMDDAQQKLVTAGFMFSISSLFHQVMFLVVLFYLAGSLYDDRRDRSILFWKSLPLSDRMTVASKIVTACIAAPVIYLAGIALTQLSLVLIATGYGVLAGIDVFGEILVPSNLPRVWLVTLAGSLMQALWLLPIYAWLVFCSSWAPRLPILIAVLVPVLIGMFQHFWSFFSNFQLPDYNLLWVVVQRIGRGVIPAQIKWEDMKEGAAGGDMPVQPDAELLMSLESVFGYLFMPSMWVGIAIGLLFLAGAVWFRRRATDN
jgi:ABC-2 type transport system permease protein